jgi:hypothetical protein
LGRDAVLLGVDSLAPPTQGGRRANDVVLSVTIAHVWNAIRETRVKIGQVLEMMPPELLAAATMAGTELLENAVKYGESVAGARDISFNLTSTEDMVQLATINGSTDHAGVGRLRDTVQRISNSQDPQALYLSKIEEAASRAASTCGSGLGLYRIAAEGHFTLSCYYDNNVVEVVAHRSLR